MKVPDHNIPDSLRVTAVKLFLITSACKAGEEEERDRKMRDRDVKKK